jgi:hemerythrin-like domain-containing protein
MMPIGPLMIEHRLIERMVKRMAQELPGMEERKEVDAAFLADAIDFIRTYADRCHHGKEEDILFRELAAKSLSPEDGKVMRDLTEEHVYGRKVVSRLAAAKDRYGQTPTEGFEEIIGCLKELVEFYPAHIEKEDKHFFLPCMKYFNSTEKDAMLRTFEDFDRNLFHEKYRDLVARHERERFL